MTEVYNQAQSYAGEILTANTPLGNEFKDSLTIDANGNLQGGLRIIKDARKITLNRCSKRKLGFTPEQELDEINEKLEDLKDHILHNNDENVRNQCGPDTFYYNWSGMFLQEKITIDERIKLLTPLFNIFK